MLLSPEKVIINLVSFSERSRKMKKVVIGLAVVGLLVLAGSSRAALTDGMIGLYHLDGNMNDSAPGSSDVGTLAE